MKKENKTFIGKNYYDSEVDDDFVGKYFKRQIKKVTDKALKYPELIENILNVQNKK
jgi:hypothetical protein